MTEREALKLALEALEEIHVGNMTPMAEINWNRAITAIKEALAQPEQEPVAWAKFSENGNIVDLLSEPDPEYVPLYTSSLKRE